MFYVVSLLEMELKKRWKNLRDNYNTERKKYLMRSKKYHSKWKHYTAMQFLKDMVTSQITYSYKTIYTYSDYKKKNNKNNKSTKQGMYYMRY